MSVRPFDRLRFWVGSHSRPKLEHLVDLEHEGAPQCSCERMNENTHYHGEICHHIVEAVNYVEANRPVLRPGRRRHKASRQYHGEFSRTR